jgi:hypothetical protein
MKRISYLALLVLVVLAFTAFLGHSADKGGLENRVRGWISAVNQRNFNQSLKYVAPPEFTGGGGLTRTIRGGEVILILGSELLPIYEYSIQKVEFFNNGYESNVSIDAKVIYGSKIMPIESEGNAETGFELFPASISQRWIFLNGEWFIKSQLRIQYLGAS